MYLLLSLGIVSVLTLNHSILQAESKGKDEPINQELSHNLKKRGLTIASSRVIEGDVQFVRVANQFQLTISEDRKQDITYIITEMATKLKPDSIDEMNRKGAMLKQEVPTLQFLAFIFTHPELTRLMKKMKKQTIVKKIHWSRMSSGIRGGLQDQYDNGTLMVQLEGFAQFVGADFQKLQRASQQKNWDEFIAILMK